MGRAGVVLHVPCVPTVMMQAHTLAARPLPCRLLAYPEDVHAIDQPASEADAWVNIALWFKAHLA